VGVDSAIEHPPTWVAKPPHHPPHTGSDSASGIVVGNDERFGQNPEAPEYIGECAPRRQRVTPWTASRRGGEISFELNEHRPGKVALPIFVGATKTR
jgi:hypothetical protein